jgi:hypothetical protein
MSSIHTPTWIRLTLGLVALAPSVAAAQVGYRLRLDAGAQSVAFRGVTLDSIPVTDTVGAPGQGPTTSDGYAVQCLTGAPYCTFFRPGPIRRAGPATVAADATVWGLGLPGVSVHAAGRLGVDLGTADVWPGTQPAVQLLQGYAEYAVPRVTARLGRQVVASRLGTSGFDGAGVVLRDSRRRIELQGYAGWGLERGVALPVTSPALNPLDDFQPERRQLVAGAGAGWRSTLADLRLDYQREVDPRSDYFVSERVALGGTLRPITSVLLSGGADYDLAAGWWGSADATLGYTHRTIRAAVGVRRYRPHFDLWTIWGAFSPVPYHSVQASLAVAATQQIELHGRYERYRFEDPETSTPLYNTVPQSGWRWEAGVTATPRTDWTLDASYRRELGPGAAATGLDASLAYRPSNRLTVTAMGSTFDRPLEFRFNEAVVHAYGVDAQVAPSERLRIGLTANRYQEDHRRPDAAAFDWNQFRLSFRVVMLFGNSADLRGLPPAIRLLPGGRAAR